MKIRERELREEREEVKGNRRDKEKHMNSNKGKTGWTLGGI